MQIRVLRQSEQYPLGIVFFIKISPCLRKDRSLTEQSRRQRQTVSTRFEARSIYKDRLAKRFGAL